MAEKKEVIKEVVQEVELCGHINRHSYGIDGQLDNLACDLPKGHAGDHSAMHKEVNVSHMRDVNRKVTGEIRNEYKVRAYWGDAAGIPVGQLPPTPEIQPPTMLELEFGKDVAKQIQL
jgi:hypothetical protein